MKKVVIIVFISLSLGKVFHVMVVRHKYIAVIVSCCYMPALPDMWV